jgi:hypothetical protein
MTTLEADHPMTSTGFAYSSSIVDWLRQRMRRASVFVRSLGGFRLGVETLSMGLAA